MTKKSSVGSESDGQVVTQRGKVSIQTTADESKVVEENKDVLAALALAEVADEEKDISTCITNTNNNNEQTLTQLVLNEGNVSGAISKKESIIEKLEKVVSFDKTGMIALALTRARQLLKQMQESDDMELLQKDVDYMGYQCSIVHRKCF